MESIRVVAVCLFRRKNRILVGRAYDHVKDEDFFRPLGGSVEFGETADEAIRREIREELVAEIGRLARLGVVENIFTYEGRPGHEYVIVFDAEFADPALYDEAALPLFEEGWSGEAVWLDLTAPRAEPLYPEGLMDLLQAVGT
jgi:ADP-ribose pyrophosphatase YjhB (NUDIX family)